MFTLESLKANKLLKKQFIAPFRKEDRRHGAVIMLLSPNYATSKKLITNPFMVDRMKLFNSYFIERDITYIINGESQVLEMHYPPEKDEHGIILEGTEFVDQTDIRMPLVNLSEYDINELFCRLGNKVIFFNENTDDDVMADLERRYSLHEADVRALNSRYKRLLYNDRLRTNKDVIQIYEQVKVDFPWIKHMYPLLKRYKMFNLFVDLYFYNQAYLQNNSFAIIRSIDMYFEFLNRILHDQRLPEAGYTKFTVFLPVYGWNIIAGSEVIDFKKNLNPLSVLYKKLKMAPSELKVFDDIDFIIFGEKGFLKFNTGNMPINYHTKFKRFLNILQHNVDFVEDPNEEPNSPDAITASIVDDIETVTGAKINNLTGKVNLPPNAVVANKPVEPDQNDPSAILLTPKQHKEIQVARSIEKAVVATRASQDKETAKAVVVSKVKAAAEQSKTKEDAIDKLEEDEELKQLLADLESEDDSGAVKIDAIRAARITRAQDEFEKKKFQGVTIKELLNPEVNAAHELKESSVPIQTINDEWHHVKAVNFEKEYNLDADIIRCIDSLSDTKTKPYPISILDVEKEDTSTSEDSIYTYTVKCEGYDGKRFSFKFDIPKFRDNRFMRLRGNEKIFSIEMPLLPISKTNDDTAQLVSFYNKIFVMRYNTSTGKSNPFTDRLMKTLAKYQGKGLRKVVGDCYKISAKYDLPIDYIDIGRQYTKIIFYSPSQKENVTIYLNQDEVRKIPGVSAKNGIPIAMTESGKMIYYTTKAAVPLSLFIANLIDDPTFMDLYQQQSLLKKATYSRAKLLNTYIPVIVVLAHDVGLTRAMDLAGIEYEIKIKRTSENMGSLVDSIRLKDGYIFYKCTYASMMLMNGLKDCDIENVSIADLNKKVTWIEQLALFGGKQKSEGLDNFRALMWDPITIDVCKDYHLPTTYAEALIYASNLLVDNKFIKHTDITGNRYRTNEIIAAQFYRVLSTAYREYMSYCKRGRKVALTMKQDAVLELIISQNNTTNLSIFQPLSEIESRSTISTKGVTGLNEERSYTIEKRGYDPSMQNIISQSTSFAGQVGVNRQTVIDPGITAGRGYFKQSDISQGSVTRSLGMTEALSPFMLTSDDPFRNNMTFVQTAKHSTPVEDSDPLLVTTGADAAMPYLSSDMFAFKAKQDGKVTAVTPDYMLITYKDGTKDYVNLSEQTMKNSDGGFFIILQLITNLKVGSSFKAGQVLAWDKKSFSKKIGLGQLSYNVGHLAKIAIMTTEDGFEDSGVCSEWLSERMGSDIVVQRSQPLPAATNILSIVKIGDFVREGEPLLVFQKAFDEDDANLLLKNLTIEDDMISTIGRLVVPSKVTGVVTDIKLFRTCEIKDMSTSLQRIFTAKEAKIKKLKAIATTTLSDVQFDPTESLEHNGKLKSLETDVLIEIYVKYHDNMSIGDKMANLNANKMVLMDVYTDDMAPYTDFRRNEEIDVVSSASSIDGRLITSPFKNGALNKLMIELQRKCCEIYGKPWMTMHQIHDYLKTKWES